MMVRLPYFADPGNLKVEDEEEQRPMIPDNIPLPEVADRVVRGKLTLSREQLRLLIELLPYHMPKLSAVAHAHFDFAKELDKAILTAPSRGAHHQRHC
jgi:hypothetical protein